MGQAAPQLGDTSMDTPDGLPAIATLTGAEAGREIADDGVVANVKGDAAAAMKAIQSLDQ